MIIKVFTEKCLVELLKSINQPIKHESIQKMKTLFSEQLY